MPKPATTSPAATTEPTAHVHPSQHQFGLTPATTFTINQPLQPGLGKPFTPRMNRHPRHAQIRGKLLI
jgi:hypothetical protein